MKCLICSDSRRLEIDREIVSSGNIAKIAKQFGVSYSSLYAHSLSHVTRQLATALEKRDTEESFNLLGRIDTIIQRAESIFHRNFEKGSDVTALKALDSQRSTIELLAKISYSLHQAKLAEMEMLNHNSDGDHEEREQEFQESLSILTIPELELLQKLQTKISTQDSKMIIIPEQPDPVSFTTRRTKSHIIIPEDDLSLVNESKHVSNSVSDDESDSWQPEPGQKVSWINGVPQRPIEISARREYQQRQNSMDDPEVLNKIHRLMHS